VATTLLLVRNRFDVSVGRRGRPDEQLLAEDLDLLAFEGAPTSPTWLDTADAGALLSASPAGNISTEQRTEFVRRVIEHADLLVPALEERAQRRAEELAAVHHRVRREAGAAGRVSVQAHVPVDVLGVYIYMPA
jgi:hypothetical protein